ncbi:MAG: hypothetical protein ACFFB5_09100 [Promethearchaeota archaeon]
MDTLAPQPPRNQTWLHQKLKNYYLDKVRGTEEAIVQLNGRKYRIDVLDKERMAVYEIHRSNFGGKFSEKIKDLLEYSQLKIIIVHPIVLKQKVTRFIRDSDTVRVSYYNKRGDIYTLFEKLVFFKVKFIPNRMRFDILFIEEHVLKESMGFWRRSKRYKYKVVQRDLLHVQEIKQFSTRNDFINVLPYDLPDIFTNNDLAERIKIQGGKRRVRRIPGCITYSLCKLGILSRVGTRGRAHEFTIQT